MSYNNVAIVWEPHFNTNCIRAAVSKQLGKNSNYAIVCCSPKYNGVWEWNPENKNNYQIYYNKNTPCYCVPIKDCTFITNLDGITDINLRKEVRNQQLSYCAIKRKSEEQDWVIKI